MRVAALGSFHRLGKLDLTRILAALIDSDPKVRRRAAELAPRICLGAEHRTQLIEGLGQSLGDESSVAEMAAFSLGEIGSQPADQPQQGERIGLPAELIHKLEHQAANHDEPLCREQAIASLGALHSSPHIILAALKDKATVRRRAVIALAPFDGPAVEAALRVALTDRDWQVRQAAEDLLGEDPLGQDPASGDHDWS